MPRASFPPPYELHMKNLMDALELYVEIEDLKKMELTEEEILGFLEVYYESWFQKNDSESN